MPRSQLARSFHNRKPVKITQVLPVLAVLFSPACRDREPSDQYIQKPVTGKASSTAPMSGAPGGLGVADGNWVRAPGDFANTRYSHLDEITAANVSQLSVAFTFSTGIARGHEAAPLVVNNTMYIITPFPNRLYALDLTKPGAPLKWSYDPKPASGAQGVACCDVVNRGGSYADGKIIYATFDNHVSGQQQRRNHRCRHRETDWLDQSWQAAIGRHAVS